MNPTTATLRLTDLADALNVSIRSLFRWVVDVEPHHDFGRAPRGVYYALPEIVATLRAQRKRGLYGDELARVVEHDTRRRAVRVGTSAHADDIWLGDAPEARAAAFWEALDGEERERARMVQKTVAGAAIATGARVERLRQITLIHPAAVRFILAGEGEELPANDAGWRSWVRAISIVNVSLNEMEAA